MSRKFKLDLIGTLLLVILPGVIVWNRPQWLGLTAENRGLAFVVLCALFFLLWLIFNVDETSRPAIAVRAVKEWVSKHRANPQAAVATAPANGRAPLTGLKQWLEDRHGWRWRSRDTWTLVVGEDSLVKRLVPELAENGYALAGGTVLIHARRVGNDFDADWIADIRRLRRRPVDAVVALTQRSAIAHAPFDAESLSPHIARLGRLMRWSAPVYLVDMSIEGGASRGRDESIGVTWSSRSTCPDELGALLAGLSEKLADEGVLRLSLDSRDRYVGELSKHIQEFAHQLASFVDSMSRSRFVRNAVQGLLFAPLPAEGSEPRFPRESKVKEAGVTAQHLVLWKTIADHSRKIHGRRVGFSFSTAAAWTVSGVIALWLIGTVISGMSNRSAMQEASTTLTKLASVQDPTQALLALDALDKQIDILEIHRKEGAPWLARFGLNHDAALMDALQPAYQQAAARVLIARIQAKLEARLNQLASLSDAEIASGGNAQVQAAYDTLKTYLMLAHPEHADAAFLSTQLLATNAPERPINASVTPGTWEDVRQHAIAFYASFSKLSTSDHLTHATLASICWRQNAFFGY